MVPPCTATSELYSTLAQNRSCLDNDNLLLDHGKMVSFLRDLEPIINMLQKFHKDSDVFKTDEDSRQLILKIANTRPEVMAKIRASVHIGGALFTTGLQYLVAHTVLTNPIRLADGMSFAPRPDPAFKRTKEYEDFFPLLYCNRTAPAQQENQTEDEHLNNIRRLLQGNDHPPNPVEIPPVRQDHYPQQSYHQQDPSPHRRHVPHTQHTIPTSHQETYQKRATLQRYQRQLLESSSEDDNNTTFLHGAKDRHRLLESSSEADSNQTFVRGAQALAAAASIDTGEQQFLANIAPSPRRFKEHKSKYFIAESDDPDAPYESSRSKRNKKYKCSIYVYFLLQLPTTIYIHLMGYAVIEQ